MNFPPPSFAARHRFALAKTVSLCAVVAIIAAYNAWAVDTAVAESSAREELAASVRSQSSGPYATDGVFTGSAQGYGGLITMQATIENGWITDVEIIDASSEDASWLDMASILPERIVEAQTSAIDVISGATFTSTGILNGTTAALQASMAGTTGESTAGGFAGESDADASSSDGTEAGDAS